MTSASSPRPANVVVVLNASDRDHFAVSGEARYRDACPPWAEVTFLADHDITGALVERLSEGAVDTVVFASNALLSIESRRAVAAKRFVAQWKDDGPSRDVGVLVMHQYLRPDESIPLAFLGSAAFTLVGEPPRRVKEADIEFRADWRFILADDDVRARFLGLAVGYGSEAHCVWARCDLEYPAQWEAIAWERGGAPLVARCASGDRIVMASRVPIDLTGQGQLLTSLVAACLRPRGSLLVEGAETTGITGFSTALARAIDQHRFIHRVRPAAAAEIDPGSSPYHHFDELILAPEWPVTEIESLSEETVLRKLEAGGSIVATFAGPANRPVTVRLSGQPQYAARANHLARWLLPRLRGFRGDIWSTRALAEAVAATQAAYKDARLIPQALRADFVSRELAEFLAERVDGDNVDEIVLPTVATYAALRTLGAAAADGMREWVERKLDGEVASVVAQALVLDSGLKTAARLDRIRAAAGGQAEQQDDAGLLTAYAAVLLGADDPDLFSRAAADRSLGLGVQAELLRAVARHRLQVTNEIVELAAHVRSRIDELSRGEGGLEAVCLGNAALVELAHQQGLGPNAEIRGRPREIDARTVANTELAMAAEKARHDAERYRRFARAASTALLGLLIVVTIAPIVAIALWFDADLGGKFGFAAGVFGVMSSFDAWVLNKLRAAGIAPWPLKQA